MAVLPIRFIQFSRVLNGESKTAVPDVVGNGRLSIEENRLAIQQQLLLPFAPVRGFLL